MAPCPAPRPEPAHRSRWDLVCSLASLLALGACGGGSGSSEAATPGSSASPPAASPAAAPAAAPAPAAWGTPKSQARIFISGHSLSDNPLADHVLAIASSLGGSNAAKYNQQIVIGSPIRVRTEAQRDFSGYSLGKNRSGDNMNVINELRNPQTLGGDRYDTLVIAERHDLLQALQWEDTVRHVRHFHDRLLAGNAAGRTYFYETWFDVSSKANPSAWIAHERAASGAWQCIATRINHSLAAEGRNDRITSLPVGAALADLAERATQGTVPGITGSSTTATMNNLFIDNVHVTTTGMYYAALVTYAAIYQRSPVGASVPSGVSSAAAASLQSLAWSYVSNFYANTQPQSLDSCRTQVAQTFCPVYWNYRNDPGSVASCTSFFSTTNASNPLYYAAGSDASYWFPAPP